MDTQMGELIMDYMGNFLWIKTGLIKMLPDLDKGRKNGKIIG
ncbi:MAG: hypothetical protein ACTSRK_07950 [Promethearchaeota archaeon]